MYQNWKRWNMAARKWLWILVVLGVAAALPVGYDRLQTESTSKNVEFVFDYRDLVDISVYRTRPQDYIAEQLDRLKQAGVGSMALFESTLDEFVKSRRITLYDGQQVADLTGKVISPNENYTYVAFNNEDSVTHIKPLIEETFTRLGISVRPWTYNDAEGLILETPRSNAVLKPMSPDPITMKMLRDKGFAIVPRLSDSTPYDQAYMEKLIAYFADNGVKRLLFDGDSVKGFSDDEEMESLKAFGELLNEHNIGLTAIENIKKPQKGFTTLAYLTDYNVARLYSLSERDATLEVEVISDRFVLASKDRNIRMFYLNAEPLRDTTTASITDPMDNLIESLTEPGNAIKDIQENGFTIGQAEAFQVADSSMQRYFKAVAVVGAIALISLMISYFIPFLAIPAFVIGLIGSAGLYVLRPEMMEQALALATSISGPTVAMILAIRKVNSNQSLPDMSVGRRVTHAIVLFFKTTILSLAAVPLVIALLNNVTYMLVLDQFRGVNLLALAPMALTAVYVLLYRGGNATRGGVIKLLKTPITLLWVIAAGVLGVIGMYYLSRTGNAGSVSSIEMAFRSFLENTIGVRPRNKEFLLAHPIMLLGLFLSFKYRHAAYLLIVGAMGQLSIVGTFTHIHSPIYISTVRGLLGLVLGLIIGLIAIYVWQIAERIWKRWSPLLRQ
ncbi:hypothetical protein SAMN05661091_0324 [Paenibacillus uliginis N3/975]|uniref:Uncharacterized protein n=1 Tax=Paenibacillus uliginis N3/975 TaxID=1313296 RepID=A0A1X7GC10_9BACL|nr:DUF5693 family protein [Paenibacillus uliginis]SMF67012.1 hypothetical protein SAMN05661091_0324 [Paenibacillus uliginis N3/975]